MKPGEDPFTRYFGIENGIWIPWAVQFDSLYSQYYNPNTHFQLPVLWTIPFAFAQVGHNQTLPLPISRYAWNLAGDPATICTYGSTKEMRHNFSLTWALWTICSFFWFVDKLVGVWVKRGEDRVTPAGKVIVWVHSRVMRHPAVFCIFRHTRKTAPGRYLEFNIGLRIKI